MSKQFNKLEEAFDLPDLDEVKVGQVTLDDMTAALKNVEQLEKAFETIDHSDRHDREMDELAALAIEAHKDLQALGMTVEVRHAGEIFSSSSQMLKIAVDAKNLKMEKKIKLMKLQLEKIRLDRTVSSNSDQQLDGTAMVIDRNMLLEKLQQINSEDK